MGIFSTSDDRFIARMEREEQDLLLKFYNLKKNDPDCPTLPYLLNPEKIHLSSYEDLGEGKVHLKIGYKTSWSGYITDTIRVRYDQIVLGNILCEGVEELKKGEYKRIGSIKIPFLSKYKIVSLPVNGSYNIEFKCKSLKALDVNIYVEKEGKLILDSEYRKILGKELENK